MCLVTQRLGNVDRSTLCFWVFSVRIPYIFNICSLVVLLDVYKFQCECRDNSQKIVLMRQIASSKLSSNTSEGF